MELPDMEGTRLGKNIKEDPVFAGVHVVMMAPMGWEVDAQRLSELDFDAYIPKPLRPSFLLETLTAVLKDENKR